METTPSAITPAILDFCGSLNAERPVYVPVRSEPYGRVGYCHVNVEKKIAASSGGVRYGWLIWERPRLYLTAEFHAVWIDPEGNLIDVTEKPDGEIEIIFAADLGYGPGMDFQHDRPENQRWRLYPSQDREELVAARLDSLKPVQIEYETRRAEAKGVPLSQWLDSRIPVDPVPALIDEVFAIAAERDLLMVPSATDKSRRECRNPQRYVELGQAVNRKIREIESTWRNADS